MEPNEFHVAILYDIYHSRMKKLKVQIHAISLATYEHASFYQISSSWTTSTNCPEYHSCIAYELSEIQTACMPKFKFIIFDYDHDLANTG